MALASPQPTYVSTVSELNSALAYNHGWIVLAAGTYHLTHTYYIDLLGSAVDSLTPDCVQGCLDAHLAARRHVQRCALTAYAALASGGAARLSASSAEALRMAQEQGRSRPKSVVSQLLYYNLGSRGSLLTRL